MWGFRLTALLVPWIRVNLIIGAVSAAALSMATLGSCDFAVYQVRPGNTIPVPAQINATSVSFGLVSWDPYNTGCVRYTKDLESTLVLTAQVGGFVGASAGFVVLLILLVEFVCCRFWCSRFFVCLLLILALIGQSLTFLLYASEYCINRADSSYPCTFSAGTGLSIASTVLFLFSAIVVCATPKPKPLVKMFMEQERRGHNTDQCCYCFRNKNKKPTDEELPTEQTPQYATEPHSAPPSNQSSSHPVSEAYPDEVYAYPPRQSQSVGGVYPVVTHRPSKLKSFANAEVVDEDLFFDSKTV